MKSLPVLAFLVIPALAQAQPLGDPSKLVESSAVPEKRLSAFVALSNSLGLATFVADDKADNPYFAQSVSIGPRYSLAPRLTLGLGWSLGWEYTAPERQSGRRYSPSDVSGSISHSELWGSEPLGLKLSGSLTAIAPTSFESRANNTVTNLTASPSLIKSLGDRLRLSYTFSFTKYLPYRQHGGDDQTLYDDDGILLCADDNCRSGQNRNFSLRNAVGLSYQFTDKLTGLLRLGISHAWSFAPEGGSWTNQRALDATSGSIGVSYAVNETYTVSGGVSSGQPALDSRGVRPRFPFADFESPANGFTSFGLTITGKI